MYRSLLILLAVIWGCSLQAQAQMTVAGRVIDESDKRPVEFASVRINESGRWAITDDGGNFTIKDVPTGWATLTIQCLGYAKRQITIDVRRDIPRLRITLQQENLKLDEVMVTAHRKKDEATTSYTIDRTALDNQQLINLGDIGTLLPGGKTVNPSLMNDDRISLRSSGTQERGNASFGTAVEIDGMRLDNNAAVSETAGASTRSISTSNIESVEIVTGIPSVEYGDLSNGIVKVNTRRGKSPFVVEGRINQHTRQIALNKGFDLGHNRGVLNASIEHARSFSDAASPHTAYQRNILSLNYMNVFFRDGMPLTLNVGLTGNVGGYNSESDPDEQLDDYIKTRDNALRARLELNWLLNKPWMTNLQLQGSLSLTDRRTESYTHASSASTQPYIHTTEEGYHMADLGPTGYWYVKSYGDQKPVNWKLKLKGDWTRRFGGLLSKLMVGSEYTGSRNNGRGTYYDDERYTPTWREYRYDELPTMHNVALYAEEKLTIPTGRLAQVELTAGLRDDITMIGGSDYGTVSSLSPRLNGRYVFWRRQRKRTVSHLAVHAGWGKSVKLPSFQVLYPAPTYADRLAFSSTSTADNTSYYAYHTYPSKALYNPSLRWQYTNQTDIGVDMTVKGTRINVSAFWQRTCRPYVSSEVFTPMSYRYTPPSALNNVGIDAANRLFSIDRQTGVVSVSDATGTAATQMLAYNTRNTYAVNSRYVNGSDADRYGLEWTVDFAKIQALNTSLRIDGNYYHYKSLDDMLVADVPLGINSTTATGQLFPYVGWYRGTNAAGSASLSNGSLSKQLNLNATLTTHIPKLRLIVALRIETSLYNYSRQLSEYDDGPRGYMLDSNADFFGQPYDGSTDRYVAVYPEYYTTWDRPDELIPFAERFAWARDNDPALYSELSKLVVRSSYPYMLNPNRISSYYSANLSITKEIGDHISLSFYANNFLNNMNTVHSSQTGLDTSLFGSSYIPSYYYGLSLRLKL